MPARRGRQLLNDSDGAVSWWSVGAFSPKTGAHAAMSSYGQLGSYQAAYLAVWERTEEHGTGRWLFKEHAAAAARAGRK